MRTSTVSDIEESSSDDSDIEVVNRQDVEEAEVQGSTMSEGQSRVLMNCIEELEGCEKEKQKFVERKREPIHNPVSAPAVVPKSEPETNPTPAAEPIRTTAEIEEESVTLRRRREALRKFWSAAGSRVPTTPTVQPGRIERFQANLPMIILQLCVSLVAFSLLPIELENFHLEPKVQQQPNTCDIPVLEQIERWSALQEEANAEIFGQHVALDGTLRSLYAHITDPNPKKALVLCFNGWLGSGKTFLSHLIAKHAFEEGMKSPFVKAFIGPRHFLLDPTKLQENQESLVRTIESTVKACPRSIFIFDEVDKMPSAIFNALVPYLDRHGAIDGIDYGRATFIFISNTGGSRINNLTFNYLRNGKERSELGLHDFREILAAGAFNEEELVDEPTIPMVAAAVLEFFRNSVFSKHLQSNEYVQYIKQAVTSNSMWKAVKSSVQEFLAPEHEIPSQGQGGLFQSEMITRSLVDQYIPFLPLEKKHVIQCAKKEIIRRNAFFLKPEEIVDRVLFFPKAYPVFAENGCKNIDAHVGYYVQDSLDF